MNKRLGQITLRLLSGNRALVRASGFHRLRKIPLQPAILISQMRQKNPICCKPKFPIWTRCPSVSYASPAIGTTNYFLMKHPDQVTYAKAIASLIGIGTGGVLLMSAAPPEHHEPAGSGRSALPGRYPGMDSGSSKPADLWLSCPCVWGGTHDSRRQIHDSRIVPTRAGGFTCELNFVHIFALPTGGLSR